MNRVIIIVNGEGKTAGKLGSTSPVTEKMVAALKKAIAAHKSVTTVEVVAASALWSQSSHLQSPNSTIYCPLTIQLPDWFKFPAASIYKACRDIEGLRKWVERNLAYQTSNKDACSGDLWLPVVLTAKEALYGEVIAEGVMPNSYEQPSDLTDDLRPSLYNLVDRLLESLSAVPSVYLLQFRLLGQEIVFDRLWPFPAAPAIASIGDRQPDLFACYWQCLLDRPIVGLNWAASESKKVKMSLKDTN
jgi:hypothetical protein